MYCFRTFDMVECVLVPIKIKGHNLHWIPLHYGALANKTSIKKTNKRLTRRYLGRGRSTCLRYRYARSDRCVRTNSGFPVPPLRGSSNTGRRLRCRLASRSTAVYKVSSGNAAVRSPSRKPPEHQIFLNIIQFNIIQFKVNWPCSGTSAPETMWEARRP